MFKRSSEVGADEPVTETFTAVSILNREGHVPSAADRSVQPQHRRDADQEGEPDSRGIGRRGAIAGGAVLAGGAAVGVAALADPEPTAGQVVPVGGDGAEGAYPGQGLLDAEVPAEAPLEPVAIDPAASTGALDEATPAVPPGAPAGAGPAHPHADGAGAASASPDPGGHDAGPDGSGGAGGGDDTAFGSGSGGDPSGGDPSGGDPSDGGPSDGDTGGGDTGGGDEGGLLGIGGDQGVLDTGLLASDSESSDDESESSGDGGGDDDGGGGLLGTGLL